MKTRLPACETTSWLRSVPQGARYDLSGSECLDDSSAVRDCLSGGLGPLPADHGAMRAAEEAFAETLAQRYGLGPEAIATTPGLGQSLAHAVLAVLRPGEHVLVERPTDERTRRIPEALGARVSRLERRYEENWAILPERMAKLLTPHTRAVIVSNLHRPTGIPLSQRAIVEIAELAQRVGAMVIVDEGELELARPTEPGQDPKPACLLADNTISLGSTAAGHGAPSVGVAWLATRHPQAQLAIHSAVDYLHGQLPAACTVLATRIMGESEHLLEQRRRTLLAGRRVVERWIAAERRVGWVAPSISLGALVRLPDFLGEEVLCTHLRERYDTQLMPGSLFEAPGFVRVSFLAEPSALEQGLSNMSAALDDLDSRPGLSSSG